MKTHRGSIAGSISAARSPETIAVSSGPLVAGRTLTPATLAAVLGPIGADPAAPSRARNVAALLESFARTASAV